MSKSLILHAIIKSCTRSIAVIESGKIIYNAEPMHAVILQGISGRYIVFQKASSHDGRLSLSMFQCLTNVDEQRHV